MFLEREVCNKSLSYGNSSGNIRKILYNLWIHTNIIAFTMLRQCLILFVTSLIITQSEGIFYHPKTFFNYIVRESSDMIHKFASLWYPQGNGPWWGHNQYEETFIPCAREKFRTYDGFCNNINNPSWGQSLLPYVRLLPPDYADGRDAPRAASDGGPLPSARLVSVRVARNISRPHPTISVMLLMWAQWVNHDLTSKLDTPGVRENCRCDQSPAERHPDCVPIEVPPDDPFHSQFGRTCLPFVRSVPYTGPIHFDYREQFNNNTSFIDASQVYASTEPDAFSLRSFVGGKLITTPFEGKDLLPLSGEAPLEVCEMRCFRGGDSRVNMLPPLTAIHTVFMREHNRITDILAYLNPHWDDERLYQEARRIVGAEIQHITYHEYLPLVFNEEYLQKCELKLQRHGYYKGYAEMVNPTVNNVFVTNAYRFGHSLIQSLFIKSHPDHSILDVEPLGQEFFMSRPMLHPGPGSVLLGTVNTRLEKVDQFFSEQITNFLFDDLGFVLGNRDLFAINIHRGRENGIPSYVAWREFCGLSVPHSFHDLEGIMPESVILELDDLYHVVEDVDLFVGGTSEYPEPGNLIGPTFACIVAMQFRVLRKGDRFWYENGGQPGSFSPAQLDEIRRRTFAKIICDNADDFIKTIHPYVMEVPYKKKERVPCRLLEELDLTPWKEMPEYKK